MHTKKFQKISLIENVIKNIAIIGVALLSINPIYSGLKSLTTAQTGDFLLIISVLLVTACFANFAFSYEHSVGFTKIRLRYLSHVATFIYMLLFALLLIAMTISVYFIYPSLFNFVLVCSLLLYIGLALYDFWDFFRVYKGIIK